MATYQLLFGSCEWPEPDERPKPQIHSVPRTEKLNVRLPRALKAHLEAAAERDGITPEAWVEQVLARSIRPDGAAAV